MITRAILGTGLLGTGMAEGALSRGDRVQVWNRTAERAAGLAESGATVAASPGAAVAGVDVVQIVLTHDAAVDSVVAQLLDEARDALVASGAVIVDHSTTSPAGTAARAERLAAEGLRYLHAPVFMSPNAARAGQGTIIAAGPRAAFDAVESALTPMCASLKHVGERADLAAAMKLFGNAMNLSMLHGLADILKMGRGLGVSVDDTLAVFDVIDVRYVIQGRGKSMAREDYTPLWTVDVARKDVGLMMGCAEGATFGSLQSVADSLEALQQAGLGERDVAILGRDTDD